MPNDVPEVVATEAKLDALPEDATASDVWRGTFGLGVYALAAVAAKQARSASGGGGGSLPDEWTDGGHGDVTAAAEDNTYSPLTMKLAEADPDVEGEPLIKLVDETDGFLGSWDTDGGLQAQSLFVPRQGVTTRFAVSGDGFIQNDVTAGVNVARFKHTGSFMFQVRNGSGSVVDVSAKEPTDVLLTLNPTPGQTADQLQLWDENYDVPKFRVSAAGHLITAVNAAPADAALAANECAIWFDSANGASKIKFKGKSADGTVVAGELALT